MLTALKRFFLKLVVIDEFFARRNAKFRMQHIKQWIPLGTVGMEIGVFKGVFSRVLLETVDPKELHLVDLWFLNGDWPWASGSTCSAMGLETTLRRVRHWSKKGVIRLSICNDLEYLGGFEDDYFDWVYLDSSHQYEHTKDELKMLRKKVAPGGIIAGDDWIEDEQHRHYGVCKAVREDVDSGWLQLLHADIVSKQWVTKVL